MWGWGVGEWMLVEDVGGGGGVDWMEKDAC